MVMRIKISLSRRSVNHFPPLKPIFDVELCCSGSIPINCTLSFDDKNQQTNGTNREQYYTAHFAHNYTRYGEYNVSVECYNELSRNKTQILRRIRRSNMTLQDVIYANLGESIDAARFNLISQSDYYFSHSQCLTLRDMISNDTMPMIWRKKTLEIIPTKVSDTCSF